MIEGTLERIAEKILALDEASLSGLWDKYKTKMEQFDTTKEWEQSVIVFFIINAVRVKNQIFNDYLLLKKNKSSDPTKKKLVKSKPVLKLVK
jgi:hypothetical protein